MLQTTYLASKRALPISRVGKKLFCTIDQVNCADKQGRISTQHQAKNEILGWETEKIHFGSTTEGFDSS